MNQKHAKLENPVRLAELNPPVTLEKSAWGKTIHLPILEREAE
jgi:hypothetical protein